MLNKDLTKLAERLNLTEHQELEPYTLTKDEEQRAIAYAIEQAQKFTAWKLRNLLEPDAIVQQIACTDWSKKIDCAKVLAQANIAKNQEQWQRSQRRKEVEQEGNRLKELAAYWTYGRVYKLMKYNSVAKFGKELDETPANLLAIKALCFFIARDDRFADELKFDRLKGLLIRGPAGTGKTHLVRCAEDNGLNPILSLSMLDITEQVKEDGKFEIEKKDNKLIYLDDVGTEEASVKHYGTNNVWFKNFIETVYHKTKCFNHLIISTNLNFGDIGDKYGFRVEGRMREMFNVIDIKGKDYRNAK